jgi:hypothetical protein
MFSIDSDIDYLQTNSSSEASQSMVEKQKQLLQKPPYLRIIFPSVSLQLYHLPSTQSSGFPAGEFFQRHGELSQVCDTMITALNDWTKSGGRKRSQHRGMSSLEIESVPDADSMDVDEDVRSSSTKALSNKYTSLSSEELRVASLNANKSWAQILRQLSEVTRIDPSKSHKAYSESLSQLAERYASHSSFSAFSWSHCVSSHKMV